MKKYPLIDILKLHHPKDTEKSAIRAFGGKKLNKIFDELSIRLCQRNKISYLQISKILKVNKNSIQNWRGFNRKYPNGHPVPLWAFNKILKMLNLKGTETHRYVIKNISHLQCGRVSKRTKATIYLTPELAKLCGAHAADGSLYGIKDRSPITARWDIGDLEKANISAAKKWVDELFDIKLPNLMKGKMSYTWTNMQVISRYLTRIFDFPVGKKTNTVKEPSILYKNDKRILTSFPESIKWKLRLEFAKEALNFDGHSTKTGGIVSIGFGCNSYSLRKSVLEIFQHFGVKFNNYNKGNKILTTRKIYAKQIYNLDVFRGNKKIKLEKLIGS